MNRAVRKVTAVLLSFMMMFTFIPVLGGMNAFAGGDYDLDGMLKGGDSAGRVEAGKTVYVLESDLDDEFSFSTYDKWKNGELNLVFRLKTSGGNETDVTASYKSGKFYYVTTKADAGKTITFFTDSTTGDTGLNNNTNSFIVYVKYLYRDSVPASDGSFTLTGHSPASAFDRLDIYDANGSYRKSVTSVKGKNDFSFKFSVSDYKPGYYNMVGVLEDGSKLDLSIKASDGEYYKTYFMSPVTEKPTIKYNKNYFSTGYNYICFRPNFTVSPEYDGVYLQLYDTKTKKWGDVYGPFGSYEILRTDYFTGNKGNGTKIQANRKYKARVMYGKNAKYNGVTMFMKGPYSNTVTVKTGKSTKPAVKSISIKVVSTKKIKLITQAHWDVYGKWIPYSEDYTWTTKYKVTVKLKKKPGTVGIMIGDKKIKGNKKTYTATFEDSGKLKGKKITIGVCTYNDAKVGGYGKVYKKKVKVK